MGFELDTKNGSSAELYPHPTSNPRTSYDLNKVNHFALSRDPSVTKIYLNGELKESKASVYQTIIPESGVDIAR